MSQRIVVEISAGELIDKITILEIKAERIHEPRKLLRVLDELAHLEQVRRKTLLLAGQLDELAALTLELKRTNDLLWRLDEELRLHEERLDFGPAFVELARGVHRENDARAALKRRINELVGSRFMDEKDDGGAMEAPGLPPTA